MSKTRFTKFAEGVTVDPPIVNLLDAEDIAYNNTSSGLVADTVQEAIDEDKDNLDLHEADVANPHAVTTTQLGLENVDNTSDADKPISTAAQTALDLKADLVGGLVPASQLPAYVDDVLEFADLASFPVTGESGKIYIALDSNFTYRWTGSVYTQIGGSGGGSGQYQSEVDSTSTGSNQILTAGVNTVRYLTNAGLVSINGILGGIEGEINVLVNKTTTDMTLFAGTAANTFLYGLTGDEIVLRPDDAISVMYRNVDTQWLILGGASASGGLTIEFKTADFTAKKNFHYYCAETVTAIQMPEIQGNERISVSPARGALWSAIGIAVTPFSGESIDNAPVDENHTLNLSGVSQVDYTGDLSTGNWEAGDPVTPSTVGNGAFVGNWEDFTPQVDENGTDLTISDVNMRWRQVGENVEMHGYFTADEVNAAELQIYLPNSYTVDTAGTATTIVGSLERNVTDTVIRRFVLLATNGDQYLNFGWGQQSQTVNATTPANTSSVLATGRWLIKASVPVAEFKNSGTTLTASDFSAKTKEVGNSVLSLSPNAAGASVTLATGKVLKDSNNTYRFVFNFSVDHNSGVTSQAISVAGITFSSAGEQPVALSSSSGAITMVGKTEVGGSNIFINTGAGVGDINCSGDVLLDSKPDWFDDNAESNFNLDIHFQEATATKLGLVKKGKYTVKTDASQRSALPAGYNFTALSLSSLEIGRTYQVTLFAQLHADADASTTTLEIYNATSNTGTFIGSISLRIDAGSLAGAKTGQSYTTIFTATDTNLRVLNLVSGAGGNGAFGNESPTTLIVEDVTDTLELTSDWD